MHELVHFPNDLKPPVTCTRYHWKIAEVAGADAAMKEALKLLGDPELSPHVASIVVSVEVLITMSKPPGVISVGGHGQPTSPPTAPESTSP